MASELDALLVGLERDLWVLMAELATDPAQPAEADRRPEPRDRRRWSPRSKRPSTTLSDRFDPPTEFVVPGETRVAALARRGAHRRAPRRAPSRLAAAPTGPHVVPYLNRLSDLLWTMARWQEGTSLPSREDHVISFDLARDVPDDVDLVVEGVTRRRGARRSGGARRRVRGALGKTVLAAGPAARRPRRRTATGAPDDRGACGEARGRRGARAAAQCERIATTLPRDARRSPRASRSARTVHQVPLGPEAEPHPHRVTVVGGGGQRHVPRSSAARASPRPSRRARPRQRARRLADRRRHSPTSCARWPSASGLDGQGARRRTRSRRPATPACSP